MSKFEERYSGAVRSGNLRGRPDTEMSDTDVLGAAGFAAKEVRTEIIDGKVVTRKGAPLAMALLRLFMADNGAVGKTVTILTEMAKSKAWHAHRLVLSDVQCTDLAQAVLAWHRDGLCRACGGHGFKLAGSHSLGEGRAVLSDAACDDCRGTRKVAFDTQFPMEQLWLAWWLREEIEREQAFAGAEAMRALGSDSVLTGKVE